MTIVGLNFFTTLYDGQVQYAGVEASLVSIDSDTSITAIWNNGVPVTQTAVAPVFAFQKQQSGEKHWAIVTPTVINTPSVATLTSSVTCPFAGGCALEIAQAGLASQLVVDGNEIRVCDQKCNLLATGSSSISVKCAVPSLSTSYSITNYQIESTDYIMGSMFVSNTTGMYALTNNNNQDYYMDTSATCNFGTYFRSGFIDQFNEVKYFMPVFVKTNIANKLKFQGSQDGVVYSDIFTVGQEIHEGWNFYDFRDNNFKQGLI